MDRLGVSFHRKFALNRPGISQVLRVVDAVLSFGQESSAVTFTRLEKDTTLGPPYIAAMRRYAYGAGLLSESESFTDFGQLAFERDSNLNEIATLWCMHYELCSPHGSGPRFWHRLVTEVIRPGDLLQKSDLAEQIFDCVNEESTGSISRKTADPAATIFLGTYSKSDALGPLGILAEGGPGRCLAKDPPPPPLWVFAYALADYWAANWGDVTGVNLTRVSEEGGIGSIFMMGSGLVNRYLGDLQREGFVVVQRRTPPFQLTRNWPNSEVFLERIYG